MIEQQVIEFARQAASHGVENHRSGEVSYVFYNEHLMNFAKLIAHHEREECAKLCEKLETLSDAEFYGDVFASAIRTKEKT